MRRLLFFFFICTLNVSQSEVEWVNDIQPTPLTYNGFGDDIAIMDQWLVIGDTENDDAANNAGVIHVYNNSSGQWLFYQSLYAEDAENLDKLGSSVDIERNHNTGETWIVGAALNDDDNGLDNGAVYAFYLNEMGDFVQKRKFIGASGISQNFGTSIALNYDYIEEIDAHLWVLAVGDDYHRNQVSGQTRATGGVTIFKKVDGLGNYFWEQEPIQIGQIYIDGLSTFDFIGRSVAIDGKTIVAGAPGDDDHNLPNNEGVDMGAIHVYVRDNLTQTWSCCSIAFPDNRERSAQFGSAVDVIKQPGNNRIIMASAPLERNQNNQPEGSIYIWYNSMEVQRLQPQVFPGGQGELFGASIAANGDAYFGSTELWVSSPFSEDKKGRIYHYTINPAFNGGNELYLLNDTIVAYDRDQYPWDTGQFGSIVASDGKNTATSSQSNYIGSHRSIYTPELPIFKNGFHIP